MLNFAEQTGSGAVIVVWYYLLRNTFLKYINPASKTPTISTLSTQLTPLSSEHNPFVVYIRKSMRLEQDCIQQKTQTITCHVEQEGVHSSAPQSVFFLKNKTLRLLIQILTCVPNVILEPFLCCRAGCMKIILPCVFNF